MSVIQAHTLWVVILLTIILPFGSADLNAQSTQNPGTRQPSANVPATSNKSSRSPTYKPASSPAAASSPVQYGSYALRQRNSAANYNANAPAVAVPPVLLAAPTTFATVPATVSGSMFVGVSAAQQQGKLVGVSLANPSNTPVANDTASALSQTSSASQNLGFGVGGNSGYVEPAMPVPAVPGPTVQVTLGFEPKFIPPNERGLDIANRLRRLPSLHFTTPIRIEFDGRTAILNGTVATTHDRDLAERVVMLESSVDDVLNQLVVEAAKIPPPPLPGAK